MRFAQVVAVLLINVRALSLSQAGEPKENARPKPNRSGKQSPVPAGIRFHPDLSYSRPIAGITLRLDLARPTGKGPFPVVVYLHGGGWVIGDRKVYSPYLIRAAQQGYVAAAVSYRLAPRHPFPAAVHDVKCAIRWLRAHAGKYQMNPDRIGVIGYSSGGNLACMLGTTHGNKFFEGNGGWSQYSSRVQAVVSYYGLSDLTAAYRNCEKGELPFSERLQLSHALTSYLGGIPAQTGSRYAQASSITHVSRRAAPTFLIHGTSDCLVLARQSELLAKQFKRVGAEVSLRMVKGAGHNFAGAFEKESDRETFRFLDRHLKGKTQNLQSLLLPAQAARK